MPKGKPNKKPHNNATDDGGEIFNIFDKGFPKYNPINSCIFNETISSVITRKGKSDGITLLKHKESASRQAFEANIGLFIRKKNW